MPCFKCGRSIALTRERSKMYVCYTNGSCPWLRGRRGLWTQPRNSAFTSFFQSYFMEKKQQMQGNRNHWINLRLTPEEHKKMLADQQKTTSKCLSAYARKLLLGKPVTVLSRDKSKDNAIEELAALRSDLGAIANNFNQVVKRLHKMEGLPNKEFWVTTCTNLQKDLLLKISSIQSLISKISLQWSQE